MWPPRTPSLYSCCHGTSEHWSSRAGPREFANCWESGCRLDRLQPGGLGGSRELSIYISLNNSSQVFSRSSPSPAQPPFCLAALLFAIRHRTTGFFLRIPEFCSCSNRVCKMVLNSLPALWMLFSLFLELDLRALLYRFYVLVVVGISTFQTFARDEKNCGSIQTSPTF